MRRLVIYVHGRGGSADEAEHYRPLFADCDVIGFDYRSASPWEAETEFPRFFDAAANGYDAVTLIANSLGAYFSMLSLADRRIAQAFLISPVVDMERLILDMMAWTNVSEDELARRGEIETPFGETLSWAYLCYARAHPLRWDIPTRILYGGRDNLTSRDTIAAFAERIGAELTVLEDGEHWFHTDGQMRFLDQWVEKSRDFCYADGERAYYL
ncbi:MAG: alpha/beta hydrolase [Oscillospiraceae bacterium]|nr:alpha/beta hydrolase [Oscillospiraceae bacterium]